MTRDGLKTTIGRGFIVQESLKSLYNKYENNLGIYTGVTDLSEEHLGYVENELLNNELLQAYFHGYLPTKKSQCSSFEKDKFKYKDFQIDVGSPKRPLAGKHYGGMWTDNLVNEINTRTAETRRSTFESWQTAESLLAENAWELVSETPWEADDVSGNILDPDCEFDYRKIYRKSPGRFMSKTGYDVFSCFVKNEKGELNFPERLDDVYLERKKRKQGTHIYMRMYEGQVLAKDSLIVPHRGIIHYHMLPENYIRNMALDCAGTKRDESSDTGMTLGDWDEDGRLNLSYADARQLSPMNVFEWVCEVWDLCEAEKRPITYVLVEREKYAIFLESLMEMKRPDILVWTIPIRGIPRSVRQMSLQPHYETGNILSKKGLIKYERQARALYAGKTNNVDIMDTLWIHFEGKLVPRKMPKIVPLHREIPEADEAFMKQLKNDNKQRNLSLRKHISQTF